MAYGEVGGDATVIKDWNSSGKMQVEFSRAPEAFALNGYSETRPVVLTEGYYLRINPEQGARILTGDDREHVWPDFADRPTGTDNALAFEMEQYHTQRRAYSVPLSDRAVSVTAWPVAEVEMRQKAQQAMTARTIKAISALSGASWGANTATATSFGGTANAYWGSGTVAVPNIQICLQGAMDAILKSTTGVIDPDDLVLVINPKTAMLMSQSAEIRGMLSNSVYSYPQVTGQMPGFRGKQKNYGLPPMLYDFRVLVEKTVRVSSPKYVSGSTTAPTSGYAIPNTEAYLLARKENQQVNPVYIAAEEKGQKVSDEEGRKIPVYSTLCGFFKEEFTTEILNDPKNRRTLISIVSDFDYQLTSPLSGFHFTAILAS